MDLYTFFAIIVVAVLAFTATTMYVYYKYGPGTEQSLRRINKKIDKKK